MSGAPPTSDRRSGFVLVSVLWIGAFLVVLAGAMLQQSRVSLAVARTGVEEAQADGLLTAAIEMTGLTFASENKRKAADGRTTSLPFAGGSVQVAVQDMNGLVDLNRAPEPVIDALGDVANNPSTARAIMERRGQPGDTDNNPWRAPQELADDRNVDPAVATFGLSYATVFATDGKINPITAPPAVLMLLPGVDRDTVSKIVAIRSGTSDPQRVIALLGKATGMVDPTPAKVFDVFLTASVNAGLTKTARATILFDDDPSVPYRLLDWRPWAVQPAWAGAAR